MSAVDVAGRPVRAGDVVLVVKNRVCGCRIGHIFVIQRIIYWNAKSDIICEECGYTDRTPGYAAVERGMIGFYTLGVKVLKPKLPTKAKERHVERIR